MLQRVREGAGRLGVLVVSTAAAAVVASTAAGAAREVRASIDRLVHYAGWSDKYVALLGTVNPVASSYFDFSVPEPMGVVGIVAPEEPDLLGLISHVAPVLVSGNSAVVLLSQNYPLASLELAEVLATSDLPAGVANLLSGHKDELVPHLDAPDTLAAWRRIGLAVPLILVSGPAEPGVAERLAAVPSAGQLRKPFRPGELLALVRQALLVKS